MSLISSDNTPSITHSLSNNSQASVCQAVLVATNNEVIGDYPIDSLTTAALGTKTASSILVVVQQQTYLLVRMPATIDDTDQLRVFCKQLSAQVLKQSFATIALNISGIATTDGTAANYELALALHNAAYSFNQFKSKKGQLSTIESIQLIDDGQNAASKINEALKLGDSMSLAKDLGNMPGNACTPTYLAEQALSFASNDKVKVNILEEDDMFELGMHSLLSVSAGSDQPAKLIEMHYNGASAGQSPVALIGKGITFDSGGISLKAGSGMDEMKYDMCGAASVIGAFQCAVKQNLPINLVAVIAASENMPNGHATKPGDIVTSMSGQTIEVLNTDAEGRLVLCDALTYVQKFNPSSIIDVATLTGACVVALGAHASAMYANDEALAASLSKASETSGDRIWRMPLWKEYNKQLKSNFADMANTGGAKAGSITAACFLARFTEGQKWAHLDIAGIAWVSGTAKGASGRPVRLLVEYLTQHS